MPTVLTELTGGLPGLPASLRQSATNPTQTARLPDPSGMTLRFPVVDDPEAYNSTGLRRFWTWAFTNVGLWFVWSAGVGVFVGGNPLIFGWLVSSGIAFFATVLFVWLYGTAVRSPLRWLAVVAAVVAVSLAFVSREPYLNLLLSAAAAALTADLLATHTVLIETCAPLPPAEAAAARRAWSRRLWSFGAVEGAELYPLTLSAGPAAACWLYWWELQYAVTGWGMVAARSAVVLGGTLAAVWAVELLSAFLWERPVRRPGTMLKAMRLTLRDWLTYDRGNSRSPGVHKTPYRTCPFRWCLAATVILGFTGFTAVLFQPNYRNTPWGLADPPLREELRTDYGARPGLGGETRERRLARTAEEIREERRAENLAAMARRTSRARRRGKSSALRIDEIRSLSEGQEPEVTEADVRERELSRADPGPAAALVRRLAESGPLESLRGQVTLYAAAFVLIAAVPVCAVAATFGFAVVGALAPAAGVAGRRQRFSPGGLVSAEDRAAVIGLLRASPDPVERDSLFLGVNAVDHAPILVPRDVFADHAHLLGDTGSGKTAVGIATVVSQLLARGDCSVVVIDLKGDDHALFEGVRADAAAAGLPLKYFTNRVGRSTHAFNPLAQKYLRALPTAARAEAVATALGLQYGRDYGRAYFGDANLDLLGRAFHEAGDATSFRDLDKALEGRPCGASAELMRTAAHVLTLVRRLADSDALNAAPPPEGEDGGVAPGVLDAAIDFGDVFDKPEAVYLHLSAGVGTGTAAEVGRLALYSLLYAAHAHGAARRTQTFVVIDEFQRVVASNLEVILQQARSLNVGLILANQTMADLKQGTVDLTSAVGANTRFRQDFAVSHVRDREDLIKASGETIQYKASWMEKVADSFGLSASESIQPRLRANDLLLATDREARSVLQIRRGAGYAQFGGFSLAVQGGYTVSKAEFERRRAAPWPDPTPTTLIEGHRERTYGRGDPFAGLDALGGNVLLGDD